MLYWYQNYVFRYAKLRKYLTELCFLFTVRTENHNHLQEWLNSLVMRDVLRLTGRKK